MSQSLSCNPRVTADSSGFPLQIRLSELVSSSRKWGVCAEEYPWRAIDNHMDGFIDLVLQHKEHSFQSMVVECKRVRQTAWVFLIPGSAPRLRSHARLWHSNYDFSKWDSFGWADFQFDPACHESMFCAIPGQDHGRRNSLERTASELVEAVEGLAFHEKALHEKTIPTLVDKMVGMGSSGRPFSRVYVPVIVTTAALQVACFEPESVSLTRWKPSRPSHLYSSALCQISEGPNGSNRLFLEAFIARRFHGGGKNRVHS